MLPVEISVDVTLNGVDYTGSSAAGHFFYYNTSSLSLASIQPSGGPLDGGTMMNMTGVGFYDYGGGIHGARCVFGARVVRATILAGNMVQCISPPAEPTAPLAVPMYLSLNGYTTEPSMIGLGDLQFQYYAHPTLSEVVPFGGPSTSGTMLTISGVGFGNYAYASVECPSNDTFLYELHEVALQDRMMVRMHTPGLSCVFGDVHHRVLVAPAAVDDAGLLMCYTPSTLSMLGRRTGEWCAQLGDRPQCSDDVYHSAGVLAVPIRVTLNGDLLSSSLSSLAFLIYLEARMDYLEPWGGPFAGGTIVRIVGEGLLAFSGNPICRFGHIEVPAIVGGLNGSMANSGPSVFEDEASLHHGRVDRPVASLPGKVAVCVAPPGDDDFAYFHPMVTLTLNGQHILTSSLTWQYNQVELHSISPLGGPLQGGTQVEIAGVGLASSLGGLRCIFGEQVVDAIVRDFRTMSCTAPPSTEEGYVIIRVSVNGDLNQAALSTPRNSSRYYYYDASKVIVSSISPALGPFYGGTFVTVRGAGFAALGPIRCQFGLQEQEASIMRAISYTMQNDSAYTIEELTCRTPPYRLPEGQEMGFVPVRVLNNGESDLRAAIADEFMFMYTDVCHGRDQLDFYALSPFAREMLVRYLALNSGTSTPIEDIEQTFSPFHDTPLHSQDALRAYAEATCFDPDSLPSMQESD